MSLKAAQPIPWRARGMGGPASARDPPRRPSPARLQPPSSALREAGGQPSTTERRPHHEHRTFPHDSLKAERSPCVPPSGAPTDFLGRARGDGWDAAGGPVPRAETRLSCLFKQLNLSRGEHVAWEDPRPRGTRLVAPRPPAYSPQAPPFEKQEVSLQPQKGDRITSTVRFRMTPSRLSGAPAYHQAEPFEKQEVSLQPLKGDCIANTLRPSRRYPKPPEQKVSLHPRLRRLPLKPRRCAPRAPDARRRADPRGGDPRSGDVAPQRPP